MVCFVVHMGWADYIQVCIEHARRRNPGLDIVFLGDTDNIKRVRDCTKALISDYRSGADEFATKYVHLSPNPEIYEKFCLERWFVILEYMKVHHIKAAMHIDSDVLLNSVTDQIYNCNDELLCCNESGHTAAFSYTVLERFCQFIYYQYDVRAEYLKKLYKWRMEGGYYGGVSDMTMVSLYESRNKAMDLSKICNDCVYDHFVTLPDGMEMRGMTKAIYYYKGNYYYKRTMTGEMIKACSIHCQGDFKKYMEKIAEIDVSQNIEGEMIFDTEKICWVKVANIKSYRRNELQRRTMNLCNKLFKKLGWYDLIIRPKI